MFPTLGSDPIKKCVNDIYLIKNNGQQGYCIGGGMLVRDDFSMKTKEELAKRVAYKCSNPQCRKPTIGANENSDGIVSVEEAAHKSASSPGGKR